MIGALNWQRPQCFSFWSWGDFFSATDRGCTCPATWVGDRTRCCFFLVHHLCYWAQPLPRVKTSTSMSLWRVVAISLDSSKWSRNWANEEELLGGNCVLAMMLFLPFIPLNWLSAEKTIGFHCFKGSWDFFFFLFFKLEWLRSSKEKCLYFQSFRIPQFSLSLLNLPHQIYTLVKSQRGFKEILRISVKPGFYI